MKQLNPLTGLRGIAAYTVLLAHGISVAFVYNGINPIKAGSERIAYFGMSLFFVLSGFVIYYNYAKLFKENGYLTSLYQFFIARFARLYPLYAVVMACSLDRLPSKLLHTKQNGELAYLTLTQSWFNLQNILFAPSWSISTECFFYLIFVLAVPLFMRLRKPLLVLGLYLITVFLFLPDLIDYQLSIMHPEMRGWIIYFSPFTRIFDFIAGILAAKCFLELIQNERKISKFEFTCLLAAIGWCFAVILFDPLQATRFNILLSNFIYTPAIAVMLILICRYETKISQFLTHNILMKMGDISYSVYLLGFTIISALGARFASQEPSLVAYGNSCWKVMCIFMLTTMFAYGSYHLVEVPARRFVRKWLSLKKLKKQEVGTTPTIESLKYQY